MQKYKVFINHRAKSVSSDDSDRFSSKYTLVDAAGGVVYNQKDQLLMIFRHEKWDLPKGKIEINESKEEAACREVSEECGVQDLIITKELLPTYHIYSFSGIEFLKKTYWYSMRTNFQGTLLPQIEEGITKACWLDHNSVLDKMSNMYGNIKDLLLDEDD